MRLEHFDLNLLIALHALLQEKSVTRAARRLNITQPAASAALRRLRETFKDDILVVHGKKMMPTAHALGLLPLVENAIATMQALVSTAATFEPATSQRMFRIVASDYVTTVLISPLLPELAAEAPRIRLEILAPSPDVATRLEEGAIDCLVTPEQYLSPEHPRLLLFEESHVVVGWKKNPIFRRKITEEIFHSCGHIVVELGRAQTFIEGQLRLRGDHRRIEVIAPSFTIVPSMLPNTDRITLMHERLARAMLPKFPLAIAPLPFEIPLMREMIQYHQAREADAGLRWLIAKLLRKAQESS